MIRPTLYLSNWSSYRTPGAHGPGLKLSMMLAPPAQVHPDAHVYLLIPSYENEIADLAILIRCRRARQPYPPEVLARYRGSLERRWEAYLLRGMLAPGRLGASLTATGDQERPVRDGETLCCGCAVDESRASRCHRAWAAPFLVRAGWRVLLDGAEVAP